MDNSTLDQNQKPSRYSSEQKGLIFTGLSFSLAYSIYLSGFLNVGEIAGVLHFCYISLALVTVYTIFFPWSNSFSNNFGLLIGTREKIEHQGDQ